MKFTRGPNNELDQTPPEDDLDQTVKPIAPVAFFNTAHSGTGWYYWLEEYPEEGSVGPFDFRDQAAKHARDSGCTPTEHRGKVEIIVAAKQRAQ